MNIISTWLYLIGTPELARKLRPRLDSLRTPPLDAAFGPEPKQCPLTVLYGAKVSQKAYADPELRPALDAWDMEYLDATDLRRYCLEIERGRYPGPVFDPTSLPRAAFEQERLGVLAVLLAIAQKRTQQPQADLDL